MQNASSANQDAASNLDAKDIRQAFFDFFIQEGHTQVASESLIPKNDPTLMFVNAGMVPFKNVFVGSETRPYKRAVSAQKCLRVSGKHNDLEEVGRTPRHHTFFEMLGNFSFGDYFKAEAIEYAWRFMTQTLGLPKHRLYATVFGGAEGIPADEEAEKLWHSIAGIPKHRILRMGLKDNFWAMGDLGPCGPCSEIHFDQGGSGEPTLEDFETGRVMEIWNNVFMQFNRDQKGVLNPLPAPCVDTGLGLERVAALLAGEQSNYHTDLFMPILDEVARAAGKPYQKSDSDMDVSMRVVADHARTTAFLIADGIQPANEGRGYVMRRIMRRAIRHGKRLGLEDSFFAKAAQTVVQTMGDAYPELVQSEALIAKVAELEESTFRRTLDAGLGHLGRAIDEAQKQSRRTLPGAAIFKLYDTYGFPKDLTETIAAEAGLDLDEEGFDTAMQAQKARSKGSKVGEASLQEVYIGLSETLDAQPFLGHPSETQDPSQRSDGTWDTMAHDGQTWLRLKTQVVALLADGKQVDTVDAKQSIEVVLSPTPFYGESGGQAGDRGILWASDAQSAKHDILATLEPHQKPTPSLTLGAGKAQQSFAVGDTVWAGYPIEARRQIRAHHSATHLLHHALRTHLGDHVHQAGSSVDPKRLRFDYTHFEAPKADTLRTAENAINTWIEQAHAVISEELPLEEAKSKGAVALFGEKYGERVRVIQMGPSVEFCGGTHANSTQDLGFVLLGKEEAVASGVRRIEAEAGAAALESSKRRLQHLNTAYQILCAAQARDLDAIPKPDPSAPAALLALCKAAQKVAQSAPSQEAMPALQEPKADDAAHTRDLAQDIRDLWQGLVALMQTKGPKAQDIATKLAPQDASWHILAGTIALQTQMHSLEKQAEGSKQSALAERATTLVDQAQSIGDIRFVHARVDDLAGQDLRTLADEIRNRLESGVACLAAAPTAQKIALLVLVTENLTQTFQAGALIREVGPMVGGKGGGKPTLAQAGGNAPQGFADACAHIEAKLKANA